VEAVWAFWRREKLLLPRKIDPRIVDAAGSLYWLSYRGWCLSYCGSIASEVFSIFLVNPNAVVAHLSTDDTFNQATTARCRILPNPLFTVAQSLESARPQLLTATLNNYKHWIFTIIDLRHNAVKKRVVSCDVITSNLIRRVGYRTCLLVVDTTCHGQVSKRHEEQLLRWLWRHSLFCGNLRVNGRCNVDDVMWTQSILSSADTLEECRASFYCSRVNWLFTKTELAATVTVNNKSLNKQGKYVLC